MSFNSSTHVISGTPTTANTYTVTVKVTDSASPGYTVTQSYNLVVNATPNVSPTSKTVARNQNFNFVPTTTGGTAPFTWSISGKPSWVALNASTGALSGKAPNGNGSASFSLTVADAAGASKTVTYTINYN
ncbi:MAG: putative Ig domain-containing protein, partial [Actinobacteria bacterium]|nr:putative Ig domain-containing protein [Actinomycetota bacterium]